jgi:hypothetical protein
MWEMGLYSAMAPFGLLVLASVWQYPAVLEEVVKWGILRWSMVDASWSMKSGAVVGLVFGLSEAVLFMTNAWASGDWQAMGMRILLTVPMHTLTASVTAWGMKRNGQWIWLGMAMVIHAGFNYLVR